MPFWTCSIKKAEIFVVHVKRGTELKKYVLQNRVGKIIVRVEKWHQHDFLAVFSQYLQKLRQQV